MGRRAGGGVTVTAGNALQQALTRRPTNGPRWLERIRADAMEAFLATGVPTTAAEEWKYTDVSAICDMAFRDESTEAVRAEKLAPVTFPGLDAHRLTLLNGRYSPDLSSLGSLPDGTVLESLARTISDEPVGPLTRHADWQNAPLVALNTAFLQDGAVLQVPAGVDIAEPVHLLHVAAASEGPVSVHPRTLIVVGAGARASVIESHVGPRSDATYFSNPVTEIVLGAGATLEHIRIEREGNGGIHTGSVYVHQDRDSRLVSHSLSFGGRIARIDLRVALDAPGAECDLNGLYLGVGDRHVDHHTNVEHQKPHTMSRQLYKGVLGDSSRAVFNGRVVVHEDAQKIQADQRNPNLLLSTGSSVNTKPELEIHADDVRCTHGATIGQLEPEAVHYLRSRGLDTQTARRLLTFGFASEMLQRIPHPLIRRRLGDYYFPGIFRGDDLEVWA